MSIYRGIPRKLNSILYDLPQDKVYELKEYKEQRNKKQNSQYCNSFRGWHCLFVVMSALAF